jgi:glycosyltransferase involved in cell wall biosynthesis
MNILYFHQHFSTPAGATGTRSYEMAQALIDRGHEVTMVCGSYGHGQTGLTGEPVKGMRTGTVDGIHIIELCLPYSNRDSFIKRSLTFVKFALKSVGIAWRTQYDLLFATSTPLTAGIPGIAMRLLKPGKPFVFEVRDLWPELPKAMGVITNPLILGAMSVLEWVSYHCATGCIGLSPGIAKGIKRRSPKSRRTVMVPNGCDLEIFKPQGTARKKPNHKFTAVFTGAHGMANGLDAVLDAAKVLKERREDRIQMTFIGDGKLKPALVERAKAEGLDNCRFLDPVPKHQLTALMQDADVGMMILANVPAFYYGTSPNKFFDYISCGLPVLNNYPGWLADLIGDHNCGIAVPPDDPEAFADALVRLADSPDLRASMGKNGRALAESQFGRKQLAAEFVGFLEAVAPQLTYEPSSADAVQNQ